MKTKKLLVGGAVVLLSLSLGACSKTIATTKGGKITQEDYYNQMKNTPQGKQVFQQMILSKVLQADYGKKVTNQRVNAEYKSYQNHYGAQFDKVLQKQNLTEASFKKQIRSNLLLREAVKDHTKFSNQMLEAQWKNYEPTITVARIIAPNKDIANKVIGELNKNGTYQNFSGLAKKASIDKDTRNKGGKLPPFNNETNGLDLNFKKAAFKLKVGQYTKQPVHTPYGWVVIYCIKHPAKGAMAEHKTELENQIINQQMNNPATLQRVVKKVLQDGNVNIREQDLKNVLQQYLGKANSLPSK